MRPKELLQEMSKEYAALLEKVEGVLEGADLNYVVPMLATLLAEAGWMTGMDKKAFISYAVEAIDRGFLEMEESNGPRSADKNHQ